jgi:5-formyltetrahydrofolate cyclo-ligase
MAALDDPKPALRELFRQRRADFVAGLEAGTRKAAECRLAEIVAPALPAGLPAASYAAVGAEIDPQFVEQRLGPHAFPRIAGAGLITFHVAAWRDLVPGPMGIPQPGPDAPVIMPRLLLVPLLAGTPTGLRLGQGGGYYDRALARLRAAGAVTAIGLAWDVQVTDMLPHDPWDQRLDWLATPTRLFDCRAAG